MKKQYVLRVGLAFTLLYAGIDSLLSPSDWIGFVPVWVQSLHITRLFALQSHSVVEIVLAVLLLTGWQKRAVASLVFLDILAIIMVNGFGPSVFQVTFRDVGLLAIALYLALPEN